jgi:hypothetical protein
VHDQHGAHTRPYSRFGLLLRFTSSCSVYGVLFRLSVCHEGTYSNMLAEWLEDGMVHVHQAFKITRKHKVFGYLILKRPMEVAWELTG